MGSWTLGGHTSFPCLDKRINDIEIDFRCTHILRRILVPEEVRLWMCRVTTRAYPVCRERSLLRQRIFRVDDADIPVADDDFQYRASRKRNPRAAKPPGG